MDPVLLELFEKIVIMYGSYQFGKDAIDGIFLNIDYKPKKIKKVKLPPELLVEVNDIDHDAVLEKKYGDIIIKFSERITKEIPKKNLINFYNNLDSLKTDEKNFKKKKFSKSVTAGTYNPKKNEIDISKSKREHTIFHELFHMASSTYKNKIRYSGFSQTKFLPVPFSIGNGLTEGYTEVITQRYFGPNYCQSDAYEYETFIAGRVEDIVGQEKMEELYLNADLLGLINELKKYNNEKKIMKFISSTDFLLDRFERPKFGVTEKTKIKKSFNFINRFLIESYSNYIKKQLEENKMSNDLANWKMMFFTGRLQRNIEASDRTFKILRESEVNSIVESVFGNTDLLVNPELEKVKEKKAA